ncbi:protein GREB1 [Dasypus novemcinctus]|uniref:protein GREB1 n=1 Tax=Dasypus novemcinctus TaxID=9361 RepID=UPI00265E7C42|nr:protein GREB1 [Dasypus novemcinctus]
MGNSYAGQLKSTRFEEVLHSSIEASLRSSSLAPRPVFSQLYLEAEQQLSALEAGRRGDNEEEEEEGDGGLEPSSPPTPFQTQPAPPGCCTADGFCQAGKDLRLASISSEHLDVPAGFVLVGAKAPSLPDHLLVCAVDRRFLPDDSGHSALLGFSGNCVGCGKRGFSYFTEFSSHINLKLSTQPKKQKHLKYYLVRSAQGTLAKGPSICWRGSELRSRLTSAATCSGPLLQPLDSSGPPATSASEPGPGANASAPTGPQAGLASDHPSLTAASTAVSNARESPKHVQLLNNSLSAPPGPSALGSILPNSGPPKKRHKGWSPESPSATDGGHAQGGGSRATCEGACVSSCVPQASLAGPASATFPAAAPGEPVSVPDNLLRICRAKPVIFKGHGNFPYLCGNLSDVVVSPLLHACYQNSQPVSRAHEQSGLPSALPLSEETQLLLTVYYLVQLGADQVPQMEDLERIFVRSWHESHLTETRQYQPALPPLVPVPPVTSAQLPWLAGLAASSCDDSVRIIECAHSLAEGLSQMFRLLVEGQLAQTNYVVIICACRSAALDSCIAVTGKYQARILSESLLSPAEYQQEVDHELAAGKVGALGAFFSTLCPEGDIDVLLDRFYQEHQDRASSSPAASSGPVPASADVHQPPACTARSPWPQPARPFQLAVAQKLLSHVCSIADSSTQNLDLGSFEKVDFLICTPPSEVAFQQTLWHVRHSGVLLELGLAQEQVSRRRAERYVLKLDAAAQAKAQAFLQSAFENPQTLFVLIHDHAHWDLVSAAHDLCPASAAPRGLVHSLLTCRELREAPNVLVLHVTAFPYALQTQRSLISPYNEVHWPASYHGEVDLYHDEKYFGLAEFIDSTLAGHSLPLLRYDSTFEAMVTALGKRFPRLHSAVLRTCALVQHYAAALMAARGLAHMKSHTSVETLEIAQSLLSSAQRGRCGHGLMVLLRVPCPPLAAVAFERLCHVRERLALERHFEIVLGDPGSGIAVGQHFARRLQTWQKIDDAEWRPQTYLELEGLPCILIASGMGLCGASLPRSLRYCDLRLISASCWERTALEQELGLAAHFVSNQVAPEKGAAGETPESDPGKLSSTDNEDEEVGAEGAALRGESTAGPTAAAHAPPPGSPAPPEKTRRRAGRGLQPAPRPDSRLGTSQASVSASATSSSGPSSTVPTAGASALQAPPCPVAEACRQPPVVFLPKLVYDLVTSTDSSGLPKAASLLPAHSVTWTSSFRPLPSKTMTSTEQSLYYRQWTVPRPSHVDYGNRSEGHMGSFHPRRLLLSGPPQVGKTGAYLQFLSILSRMLVRLTEVDVYDEEEINTHLREESDWQYVQLGDPWPDLELFKKMPFDYIIHDPKYEDASIICSHLRSVKSEDREAARKAEDPRVRRQTARMRLSKYAAYDTYHHCGQCRQYMGFHPRYQLYESSLHAFAFSYSALGEEVRLHFIIPKSKEHHFVFSQPGGQLESMRLPLVSDKSHAHIKSPTFTPSTGRHEHGLFNLYHAMDGASHLHVLVVKEHEMAVYQKCWPNHIVLVLPRSFNSTGVGAAHFLIKELSYHNLELERSRQEELGVQPQDIWPFVVISDDSCVMWNVVDVDGAGERSRERSVSLKHVLQHIEAAPDVTQYALIGVRKWSSKTQPGAAREPFSRCHVHDFVVLNVDLTQNVQYNQNRFTCDDVDFNLRVHSSGLLLCRFNRFSVMKKQIAVGGHRAFPITSTVTDNPVAVVPAQYICAPDSKHTFLAAPAQLLLEKFLRYHSHRFFPLSLKKYNHPVLSVDCYLNLGPQISVCYVSSRPHSSNVSCPDVEFSGLLLYLCDAFVGASFLKKFHFLKGATLCVICQDRSSLRQTVVRLELEDEWQFRLRDEFQTANAQEDRPLFFLTGRHI